MAKTMEAIFLRNIPTRILCYRLECFTKRVNLLVFIFGLTQNLGTTIMIDDRKDKKLIMSSKVKSVREKLYKKVIIGNNSFTTERRR